MKILRVWDERNYDPRWRRFVRRASRAVVLAGGGKIAMIRSTKEDFYKFPGGGLKRGESPLAALMREPREEAGLALIPSTVKELGLFREIRKSVYDREIYDQRSYYYTARARSRVYPPRLEPYEESLGFVLEFVTPEEAYRKNSEAAEGSDNNYLLRETCVLGEIVRRGIAAD